MFFSNRSPNSFSSSVALLESKIIAELQMITVKVFPTLRSFLPKEIPGDAEFSLLLSDYADGPVNIEDLVAYLEIPPKQVHMVILNGQIVRDFKRVLKDGDKIVLSPPIAGG